MVKTIVALGAKALMIVTLFLSIIGLLSPVGEKGGGVSIKDTPSYGRVKRATITWDITLPTDSNFQTCIRDDTPRRLSTRTLFCLPYNRTTDIFLSWKKIFLDSWTSRSPYKGSTYGKGYVWYMTALRRGWGNLVAETGQDWRAWMSDACAKAIRPLIKLTQTMGGIQISIQTDKLTCGRDPCLTFFLSPWSRGENPYYKFYICVSTVITMPMEAVFRASEKETTEKAVVKLKSEKTTDDEFISATGISQTGNNWLLLMENAAKAINQTCITCMGPRPLLRVVPAQITPDCVNEIMTKEDVSPKCMKWNNVYPVTTTAKDKPNFSTHVAFNHFTCLVLTGHGPALGAINVTWCAHVLKQTAPLIPRSDLWWWCGQNKLYDSCKNAAGLCALVSLLLPVSVFPSTVEEIQLAAQKSGMMAGPSRRRRSAWREEDPTYIDAIGVPRGVPDEYKLVNQIAAGWESIFLLITPNKNVDRINYLHYNVQKLGNYTEQGFVAIKEQLAATSLMTFQNRIAVDMLLAEKGGVCAMFGDECCTYIPNNTSPEGSLTDAIDGLQTLNRNMKKHSGVSESVWQRWWRDMFGEYRNLAQSVAVSVALFATILTLCGCCIIPCLRSLISRLITTAIAPTNSKLHELYPLLRRADTNSEFQEHGNYEDGLDENDLVFCFSDLPNE
ncbi:uncharacterized protein LOC144077893 [Stigmatopora argus]